MIWMWQDSSYFSPPLKKKIIQFPSCFCLILPSSPLFCSGTCTISLFSFHFVSQIFIPAYRHLFWSGPSADSPAALLLPPRFLQGTRWALLVNLVDKLRSEGRRQRDGLSLAGWSRRCDHWLGWPLSAGMGTVMRVTTEQRKQMSGFGNVSVKKISSSTAEFVAEVLCLSFSVGKSVWRVPLCLLHGIGVNVAGSIADYKWITHLQHVTDSTENAKHRGTLCSLLRDEPGQARWGMKDLICNSGNIYIYIFSLCSTLSYRVF